MSIVHAAPATAGGLLLLPRRLPPSQASASLSPTPARAAEPQHPVPAVAPPESLLRPETVRKCPHAGLYATALTVRPANLLSTAPCAKGPLETMVSSMAALSSWLWSHRPRPAELGGEPSASAATPSNLPPLSLPMTTGGMLDWPRLDVDKLPRMVAACAQRCIHRLDALERDLQRPLDPTGAGLPDRVRATTPFDWVLQPVTAIQRELALVWGVLNHLLNVRASPALRRVYDAAIPQLMALEQRLLSSRTVHAAVAGLRDRPEVWARLDSVQRRAVEVLLQDAELAGVQLSPARQKLLNTVRREGTQMSSEYAANLLQTGQAWHLTVEDRRRMAGMPHAVWALAAAEHRAATGAPANPDDGPWRLTLNVAGDVLCLAEDRQLREAVLTAFCQKGLYTSATPAPKSSLGGADNAAPRARYAAPPKGTADGSRLPASPFPVTDNSQVVRDLLTLRQLEAGLLGFDSYADLSVHYKMARRVARAQRLLNQTRLETWAAARRELQTLQRFAQEHGLQGPLQPWDISYYTTLLTRRRFHFTEADVAAYFPFPRVVQLLATVCRQVLGVDLVEAEAPVWHADVRFYRVLDTDTRQHLGDIYLDPFARPSEKKGGAWAWPTAAAPCASAAPLPVACINLNIPAPAMPDGRPEERATPLVPFDHIVTLFHEMGHALQHILSTATQWQVAGINGIPFDAIEVASQLFERFAFHWPTIQSGSGHYQTGAPIPVALWDRLLRSRAAFASLATLKQVLLAAVDLELHDSALNPLKAFSPRGCDTRDLLPELYRTLAGQYSPEPVSPGDSHAVYGAAHLFDGPYAAAYYSYKWSDRLAAEYYAAFEELGFADCVWGPNAGAGAARSLGRRLRRTLYSLGGTMDPAEVFRAFRGRPPAFLDESGPGADADAEAGVGAVPEVVRDSV